LQNDPGKGLAGFLKIVPFENCSCRSGPVANSGGTVASYGSANWPIPVDLIRLA
jgi:hypothetical protein